MLAQLARRLRLLCSSLSVGISQLRILWGTSKGDLWTMVTRCLVFLGVKICVSWTSWILPSFQNRHIEYGHSMALNFYSHDSEFTWAAWLLGDICVSEFAGHSPFGAPWLQPWFNQRWWQNPHAPCMVYLPTNLGHKDGDMQKFRKTIHEFLWDNYMWQ